MSAILLAWAGIVAGALFLRRCPKAAALLLVIVLSDGARLALAPLRAFDALPYVGASYWLWLSTEIAPALLPPAVALALTGPRARSTLAFIALLLLIGGAYPSLRGGELVALLGAIYVSCYGLSVALILGEVAQRERPRLSRDALALLAILTTGIAGVILVAIVGSSEWWAVSIPFGLGLVGAVAVSLDVGAKPEGPPPPGQRLA